MNANGNNDKAHAEFRMFYLLGTGKTGQEAERRRDGGHIHRGEPLPAK